MKKILIVDDSKVMRKMLREELTKRNFDVVEAADGQQALQMVAQELPDLIISDINMPHLDGWEFCWRLKKNAQYNKIPFIFLSANNEVSDRVKGIQLGADDYVVKPFSAEELVARVQNLFQRYSTGPEPELGQGRTFTGNLAKVELPSLLQFLNMNGKSGLLEIHHDPAVGQIYIQEGDLVHSTIGEIEGKKALYRILGWKSGTFSFEEGVLSPKQTLRENSLKLIMDGLKELDELERMEGQLPPSDATLEIDLSILEDPEFGPTLQEFFQLVHREKVISKILDQSPLTDLQIYQIIDLMLQEGLFVLTHP